MEKKNTYAHTVTTMNHLPWIHVDTLPRTFYRLATGKLKHGSNYRSCVAVDAFTDYSGEPSIEVIFMYGGHSYSLIGNGASRASYPRLGDIVVATMWSVLPVKWCGESQQYVSREIITNVGDGTFKVTGLMELPFQISCVE